MKRFYFIILNVFFLYNISLSGQTGPDCQAIGITVPINFITSTATGDVFPGDQFCLELGVEDFNSVIGFQFTFSFDPTSLEFSSFSQNPGSLTGPLVHNPSLADQGLIPILWTNANSEGESIPDGMGIANICFTAIGSPGPIEICVSNNIPGVTPVTEVSYQIDPNTTCSDSILLLDGNIDCSFIDVMCSDLTLVDVSVCNSGSIEFSVCGGSSPYDYTLTGINGTAPGTTTAFTIESLNNLPSGTYTLEVIDAAGTTVSQVIDITATPDFDFDFSISEPTCSFSEDGEIRIFDFVNGTAPYVITGIYGITQQNVMSADTALFERIANGIYDVTVEDALGCSVTKPITVATPELVIDTIIVPPSCVGASDGSVIITVSGGTPFPNGQYSFDGMLLDFYETDMPFLEDQYVDFLEEFRIRIGDASSCPEIEFNFPIPVADTISYDIVVTQDVACKGDSTGSFFLTNISPGPFNNYIFPVLDELGNLTSSLGGSRNDTLIYDETLAAGNYIIQIENFVTGCIQEATFTINEPVLAIDLTPNFTAPNCGMSDGEATVAAFGGTQPYTYIWADDPTETTNTLSDLDAGMYSVTVIDDMGCSDSLSIEVEPGGFIDLDAMLTVGLGCDNMGTGELAVTINDSSTPPISFTWFNDMDVSIGMGQMINVTSPGLYYVEVVSADCTARDTVDIIPGMGFTFDIIPVNPTCPTFNNGSISLENFTGGVAPYECMWSPIPFVGCDNPNLSEGDYMVTVIDADGCEVDTMITLTNEFTDITFSINTESPICPGEMNGIIEILGITGGQAPYTCEWADPTITTCNPTDLPAGIYDFVILDVNGCMSVDTFAEILPNTNIIDFTAELNNPECGGALGSIDILSGSGSTITIMWADPTLMGNTLTDLDSGMYPATITDANGCTVDTTFTLISESDNFMIDFDINVPDCSDGIDGSISLLNCIGCDCSWEEPTLNVQGCDLVSLSPGMYRVTITDQLGCQIDTTLDLSVPDAFEATVTDITDADCFGEASGRATASVINDPRGVGIYDYIWSNGNTDNVEVSATDIELPVGDNFVIAFDGTCVDTVFFEIGEPEELILDTPNVVTEMASCFMGCDGVATLSALGGTSSSGTYTFRWEDGIESDSRDDLCAGTNIFTIIDDNGCETLDSIFIEDPDLIVIDTVSLIDVSCQVAESGQIIINVIGGCDDYTYEWTDGVSDSDTASDLPEGEYTVTVTDGCGCTAESTFVLSPPSMLEVVPLVPEIPNCIGDQVCIGIESVTGGTGFGYTYTILGFEERIPIDSCVMRPSGPYTIVVNDSSGCPSDDIDIVIQPPNEFTVDLGPDLVLSLGDTDAAISANLNGGSAPFTYNWNSLSPFDCIDEIDCDMITIPATNFANYQVLVIDANGCEAFDEINVEISTERNVYIPDSFSPNAENPVNRRFMLLTGQGVDQLNFLTIFDRWGNVMYQAENIQAPTNIDMGWDGTKGIGANSDVEAGVYVYFAEVQFLDNVTIKYSGSLTLIR